METQEEWLQRREITKMMLSLHLRVENDGYRYLREVLAWMLQQERRVQAREAYRVVAMRYEMTAAQVESAIKHVIKNGHELQDRMNELYGKEVVHEKLTPKTAIAFMFEYLRLYCDEL